MAGHTPRSCFSFRVRAGGAAHAQANRERIVWNHPDGYQTITFYDAATSSYAGFKTFQLGTNLRFVGVAGDRLLWQEQRGQAFPMPTAREPHICGGAPMAQAVRLQGLADLRDHLARGRVLERDPDRLVDRQCRLPWSFPGRFFLPEARGQHGGDALRTPDALFRHPLLGALERPSPIVSTDELGASGLMVQTATKVRLRRSRKAPARTAVGERWRWPVAADHALAEPCLLSAVEGELDDLACDVQRHSD